eukprot:7454191-Alexandrium_andersonii.AAC.1
MMNRITDAQTVDSWIANCRVHWPFRGAEALPLDAPIGASGELAGPFLRHHRIQFTKRARNRPPDRPG